MTKGFRVIMWGILTILLVACSSVQVERTQVDKTIDLSGRWNDTDSQQVSDEMIKDVLSRPWHQKFLREHKGKTPTIVVGDIRNRSYEHINTRTFTKDLERAMTNSGEVDFVANKEIRGELRDELKEQSMYASEDSAKTAGEEVGADYMLKGEINAIQDKLEGEEVMYYQVNLELVDIQTHKKVWIGEKKIKKYIERSRLGI